MSSDDITAERIELLHHTHRSLPIYTPAQGQGGIRSVRDGRSTTDRSDGPRCTAAATPFGPVCGSCWTLPRELNIDGAVHRRTRVATSGPVICHGHQTRQKSPQQHAMIASGAAFSGGCAAGHTRARGASRSRAGIQARGM